MERTYLQHIHDQQPPIVVLGIDATMLQQSIIERTVSLVDRPTVVALLDSTDESLMVDCYRRGANRVLAVTQCSPVIFQALITSLQRSNMCVFPPYRLKTLTHTVSIGSQVVCLHKRSFDVARYFFVNNTRTVSKATLLHELWNVDPNQCETRRVESQIYQIRKRLSLTGEYGWELRTRRNHGYALCRTDSKAGPPNC